MVFRTIDSVLPNVQIDLVALKRNTQSYRVLLYQHEGMLQASPAGIRNEVDVTEKISAVLSQAATEKIDLLLTPEYCCPWQNLRTLIEDKKLWPGENALWVLGLESITLDELTLFKSVAEKFDIIIYFDEAVLKKQNRFLDPLCYLLIDKKTKKLVVALQFKTKHMGVWSSGSEIERDNMIEGEEILILKNSGAEPKVFLISVICSEAMVFPNELTKDVQTQIDWADKPFLIFNPQCNADPAYPKFIDFRKFVFEHDRKEIITLNWNVSSKVNGLVLPRYATVRSSFLIKSNEVETTTGNVIKANHKRGLYYYGRGMNRHMFLLNGKPSVFLVRCTAVAIEGLAVLSRRDGPKVEAAYEIQHGKLKELSEVPENHVEVIHREYHSTNIFLTSQSKCIIDKERLVCLSIGKIDKKTAKKWHEISELHSFKMDEAEQNNRLTTTEDTYQYSLNMRAKYLEAINELDQTILTNSTLIPESLADLRYKKLQVGFYDTAAHHTYRYNVITLNNEPIHATVCYLGVCTDKERQITFDALRMMFDELVSSSRGRVAIFYKEGTSYKCLHDPNAGKITETYENNGPSILK